MIKPRTVHPRPVVKLVPITEERPSPIGSMSGTVRIVGDIVSPDFEAWGESGSDPLTGRSP